MGLIKTEKQLKSAKKQERKINMKIKKAKIKD